MEHILEYKKLVCKIASKYSYYSEYEDLCQVGMVGLLKALEKYIPNPNTKFSTYAVFWIRGEILEYLRKDKNIKISKETLSLLKEIESYSEVLRQKLGREPNTEELAFFMEKDESSIIEAICSKDLVLSSDYTMNQNDEEKNINIYDTVPYYEKGYDEDILTLKLELKKLSSEEQKIIYLRYFQDKSQIEVSKELGTNQVNISRKEAKILQKLRQDMVA